MSVEKQRELIHGPNIYIYIYIYEEQIKDCNPTICRKTDNNDQTLIRQLNGQLFHIIYIFP